MVQSSTGWGTCTRPLLHFEEGHVSSRNRGFSRLVSLPQIPSPPAPPAEASIPGPQFQDRLLLLFLLSWLAEKRFDEAVGVELGDVGDLLAGADEADGYLQFVGDGEHHTALRRPVQLRHYRAIDVH